MASTYTDLVGPPPLPTTYAFRRWYFDLLKARLTEAPIERSTTHYFDVVTGNDTTGDGSASNPWKTLVKAQQVHDAWTQDSGGLALLLHRGQTFPGVTGLDISKDHVTVAGYGEGARPCVSRFTLQLPSGGGGWTQISGTHYKRGPMLATIAWVRLKDSIVTPPQRMADAAGVTATTHSWWYDAGNLELHVNFGVDPNTLDLDGAYANSDDGIIVSGDGCRIDGLRCEGWGMNPDDTSVQRYGIRTTVTDDHGVVVSHCDAYFNGRHNIGQYAAPANASGGMATFVNCRGGWTLADTAGETAFVGYTYLGGTELILHDCTAADAHLPESGRSYPRNVALKTHQGSGKPPHALLICWGFTVEQSDYGFVRGAILDGSAPATELEDVRAFNVGERIEVCDGRGAGQRLTPSNIVAVNCDWRLRPTTSPLGFVDPATNPADGWLINSRVAIDLTGNSPTANAWAFYYGSTATAAAHLWHCQFEVIGDGISDVGFARETLINDATYNGFPNGELRNCIVQLRNVGSSSALCFNADAQRMTANAVSTDTLIDGTDRQRYSIDASHLRIGQDWRPSGHPVGDMFLAGQGSGVVRVEFDANWQPRNAMGPTIGPCEPGYAQTEMAALQATVDTALATLNVQLPAQTVSSLLAAHVDGVSYQSMLEAVMAVLFGVATRSGGDVTFFKQDATTPKVTVTLGTDAGERPASTLS